MKNFIPKPYKKEPVTLRIDIDKLSTIDALAHAHGMNRSELINRCIDFALAHMDEATSPTED